MPSPTRCRCPPIRSDHRCPTRIPNAAPPAVVAAVRADPDLTAQQRKALEESYLAFREVTIERRRVKGRRNGAPSSDVSNAIAD